MIKTFILIVLSLIILVAGENVYPMSSSPETPDVVPDKPKAPADAPVKPEAPAVAPSKPEALKVIVCGDNICEMGENNDNCPKDCEASATPLKIAPPSKGVYIGQWEWVPGDVDNFQTAIGKNTAFFGKNSALPMTWDATGRSIFSPSAAQQEWNEGKIVIVHAYEASPDPLLVAEGEQVAGFTIDKLLNGDYENHLKTLAAQFRQFGKPMFFMTVREPNVGGEDWLGGFGPNGDMGLQWAFDNQKGLAEFDPSKFPNSHLYSDLGNPQVSDGIERLIAAQRYYHDYFVRQEGLDFLTFDSMGWGTHETWQDRVEFFEVTPGSPNYQLAKTSFSFANFYPGDQYVDWISLTFYIGANEDSAFRLGKLKFVMEEIRAVAPNKPVLIIELGFPYYKDSSQSAIDSAKKIEDTLNEIIQRQPEIKGFGMWSDSADLVQANPNVGYLIKPNTERGDAFKAVVSNNPDYFHECIYFSDGSKIPTCK